MIDGTKISKLSIFPFVRFFENPDDKNVIVIRIRSKKEWQDMSSIVTSLLYINKKCIPCDIRYPKIRINIRIKSLLVLVAVSLVQITKSIPEAPKKVATKKRRWKNMSCIGRTALFNF
ncbi:MAG: hypothetical protein IPI12_15585 [Ignavibacteriales bacterium]|nr:hypothetical protein [Ignavibacteriales bacterium]